MSLYSLLRPLLFKLPPETAHNLAIEMLASGFVTAKFPPSDPRLHVKTLGLQFPNPIGLAAGFDKNADVISPLLHQGFGFIEVGTITPRPQKGNPKPRLFRFEKEEAVINRMGFNNKGCDYTLKKLKKRPSFGLVGVNIGKNKETEDAVDDYLFMMNRCYAFSDYLTVNISSPNTPGLRDLQAKDALHALLTPLIKCKKRLAEEHRKDVPLLVKISPDNSDKQLHDIADVVMDVRPDGLIISNTTVGKRDMLDHNNAHEQGGLSGKPLFGLSTDTLRTLYELTEGAIPLIGVGGISSGEDAYQKIRAGASLVQLYSSLIYKGFGLIKTVTEELLERMQRDNVQSIKDIIGIDTKIEP